MAISARFPPSVEAQLVNFCIDQGKSKSEVLVSAVTQYLRSNAAATPIKSQLPKPVDEASPVYTAFESSGFIGKGSLGVPLHGSATNARVADVAKQKISQRR